MIKLEVGKTYLTRRGRLARIIYVLDTPDTMKFVAVVSASEAPHEDIQTYRVDGRYDDARPSSLDLVKLASS